MSAETGPALRPPKVTIGGDVRGDASRRFVAAWHRAARGEAVDERHIAFEGWKAVLRRFLRVVRPT